MCFQKPQRIAIICSGLYVNNLLPSVAPGVLRISIDGYDLRIFLGFKFSIPGFFLLCSLI